MGWHRVASHLGIPVEELKTRITFTEFLDWLEFLNWSETHTTKQDKYLAQIAAEIRRTVSKEPRKVKTTDFILQPVSKKDGPETEKRIESKETWAKALGVSILKR